MNTTEKKVNEKKYIPSDRLTLYTKVTILEELEKRGSKKNITKNQMALEIIKEHLGMDA